MHRIEYARALSLGCAILLLVATKMPAQNAHGAHGMSMTSPLGIPMDRMGSGTTWIPDAVPLPSRHGRLGEWDFMLHGFVFAQYITQSGPRGDDQFGSLNWGMLMLSRPLAGGRFITRTMLSLDPATVTSSGYPLLLQSGEIHPGAPPPVDPGHMHQTWLAARVQNGATQLAEHPLVDRQHPHDFWMELAAVYERAITPGFGFSLYAAPAGEPALSPVAFMHRPSAMDDPIAPLGHHWQDATHVTFGVLTAGVFGRNWKLEGSLFNGRQPNEKRWDFDRIKLDSYSGRLTVNPGSQWSLALGYGYLDSPEPNDPAATRRVTASVLHGRRFGTDGQWATTAIWGANAHSGEGHLTHSALLETEAILDNRNTLFARAELVQKTAGELDLSGFAPERSFNVGHVSLAYIRELTRVRGVTIGLGARSTVNLLPESLEPVYESRTPLGLVLFLRLRPWHEAANSSMQEMHRPN